MASGGTQPAGSDFKKKGKGQQIIHLLPFALSIILFRTLRSIALPIFLGIFLGVARAIKLC
jgi:hypothetical protein